MRKCYCFIVPWTEAESNGELDDEDVSLENGHEDTSHNIEIKSSEKESSNSDKPSDAGRTTTDETVEKGRVRVKHKTTQ